MMSMNLTTKRRKVNGVLLLDKSTGITSNAALQRAKHLLCAVKAGHSGTLDPLASGLLPLCFGEATKFSSNAFLADKVYLAEIRLGVTTTTGDAEGEIVTRLPVNVGLPRIKEVLQKFVGTTFQMPPRYSAVKYHGKPLYVYARAGEDVAVKPRMISIYDLQLLDNYSEHLRIRVHCGSGTYVRALAEDIGRELGCGGMLSALRRITVGELDIASAVSFDEISAMATDQIINLLLPVDSLVAALPVCLLEPTEVRKIITGRICRTNVERPGRVRLYDSEHKFIGVGEVLAEGSVAPRRLLSSVLSAV
jgi:tRNA pseudouridine55 synthase